jgi:hypothetical protein
MHILPRTAALEHAAHVHRLLLLVSTCVGAPVSIRRWVRDGAGLPVPVWGVPADAADRARELGLRVEVE